MPFNAWAFGGNIYILNSGHVLEFIYKSLILWQFIGVLWTVLNNFLSGAWFPFSETNAWKWDCSVMQCVYCLNNQSHHHPQWPHLPQAVCKRHDFRAPSPRIHFSVYFPCLSVVCTMVVITEILIFFSSTDRRLNDFMSSPSAWLQRDDATLIEVKWNAWNSSNLHSSGL